MSFTGNDTLHRPNPWEFLISNKYHLVWCNVFKAASTSWMYNFNLLAGYSPHYLKKSNIVPLTLARRKYPRPSVAQVTLLLFIFQIAQSLFTKNQITLISISNKSIWYPQNLKSFYFIQWFLKYANTWNYLCLSFDIWYSQPICAVQY